MNEQNKEVYLTQEGFEQIKEELNDIEKDKLPTIKRLVKEARELGDLSENADYHAAREEQALLESRKAKLQVMIENAIIIKEEHTDKVVLGSKVTIEYEDGEKEEYKIVGSQETNPDENKISNESPIGKSVMGRKVGDSVMVTTQNGSEFKIKIVSIN